MADADPCEPLGRTLGEVLHRARVAGGEQRPRPWPPERWADRDPQLQRLDEAMAEAVAAAVREQERERAETKLAEVRAYCEQRWVERDGFSWVRAYDILAIIGTETSRPEGAAQ